MVANLIMFFESIDSGRVALFMTLWLSQYMLTGPIIGIPNMHSLYWRETRRLAAMHKAINSLPKVELSMVFGILNTTQLVPYLQI